MYQSRDVVLAARGVPNSNYEREFGELMYFYRTQKLSSYAADIAVKYVRKDKKLQSDDID